MAGEPVKERTYSYPLNSIARKLVFFPETAQDRTPATTLVRSSGSLAYDVIRTEIARLRRPHPSTLPDDPKNNPQQEISDYIKTRTPALLVLLANDYPITRILGMTETGMRRLLHVSIEPYITLAKRRIAEIKTSDMKTQEDELSDLYTQVAHWSRMQEQLLEEPGDQSQGRRR